MGIEEKTIKPKLGRLELAKQLGPYKVVGDSVGGFYRSKELYEQREGVGSPENFKEEIDPKEPHLRRNRKGVVGTTVKKIKKTVD